MIAAPRREPEAGPRGQEQRKPEAEVGNEGGEVEAGPVHVGGVRGPKDPADLLRPEDL